MDKGNIFFCDIPALEQVHHHTLGTFALRKYDRSGGIFIDPMARMQLWGPFPSGILLIDNINQRPLFVL